MKRLSIWVLFFLSGLFTLQAQESEPHSPRILGLDCYGNQLSSLDVSGCTSLTSLSCIYNQLSSLDVSGCTSLTSLSCIHNQLSSLDVSKNTALTRLDCSDNQLTSLDVSGHTALTSLACENNQLMSLNVSGCTALPALDYGSNDLPSLDVSGCISLKSLCGSKIDTLKIHGISMDTLKLATGQIKILDASGCTSLTRLEGGAVGSLDISGCTALEKLIDVRADTLKIQGKSMNTLELYDVDSNNYIVNGSWSFIGVLDASGCTSLIGLGCAFSVRNSLDVSGCTALEILHCRGGQLTSLDLSGCTALEYLYCDNNQLTSLDVSGCTALTNLSCYSNQLSSLDVSGCTSLASLSCYNNQLNSLDVSGCISLKKLTGVTADTLRIHGESMDTLTIEGWKENIFLYNIYYEIGVLDAAGCTTLRRITCTPYSDSYASLATIDRLNLQGCTSLTGLDCSDIRLSILDVSGCTSLKSLDCGNNQLSSLDVSGCTALAILNCLFNYDRKDSRFTLLSLDVSGCTALTSLNCSNNWLNSLDVSGCTALMSLDCCSNRLSSLDVSKNTALTSLNCSNNRLNSLDVSGCTALMRLDCCSNRLSSLDVSGCTALTSLNCCSNWLSSLDVSKNTALTSLDCSNNRLSSLDVSKNTLLSSLNCEDNRIPLSMLYKARSQNSNWKKFAAYRQSDSTTILVNRLFDLSSERIVGQTLTTFALTDAYGREVASDFWTENKFVFQFHEPLNYKLSLENKVVGSGGTTFTWYISVVEEMPVRYFTVQVSSNNTEWGTATITGNGTYEEGTEVTITASSKEGYRFINWTRKDGSVFSTEAVHTFTVSENVELTANFEKLPEDVETFTVAVAANNAEWGRVSQTGDGQYEKDEEITVTAKANAGYRFVNWTGKEGDVFSIESVHTFAVTENLELTANFERLPETETFTVSLSSNNPSWGIVSLIGNGICERGEAITIIATPMMGCRFINWTRKDGSVFSTEAVHTFAVTENLELTANFEQNVANESRGNDGFFVYVQDHTIHLSAERGLVQVYNATGVCVYSGHAKAIPVKSSGLYIVRVGERAYKAMVR